jgi:hypothetical protein
VDTRSWGPDQRDSSYYANLSANIADSTSQKKATSKKGKTRKSKKLNPENANDNDSGSGSDNSNNNNHLPTRPTISSPTKRLSSGSQSPTRRYSGSMSPKKSILFKHTPANSEPIIYPTKALVLTHCEEFDRWVKLRANCMGKLHTFATAIVAIDEKRRGEICQSQLIFLLQMHRNVTSKLISLFRAFDGNWSCHGTMIDTRNDMLDYIKSIAHSLDFLCMDPFIEWIGVDTRLNPFVLLQRIDDSAAEVDECKLHSELNDPEIMNECSGLGRMLYKYYTNTLILTPRELRRRVTTEDRINTDDVHTQEQHEDAVEDATITRGVARMQFMVLARWWKGWQKSRVYEKKWTEFRSNIVHMNKRLVRTLCVWQGCISMRTDLTFFAILLQVFERLHQNVWCSASYRRLQQRSLRARVYKIVTAWKEYTVFCHRLGAFRGRALLLHCKQYLMLWRRVTREERPVRTYWKHFRHHRMKWLFRALRNNRILSKYVKSHLLASMIVNE